MEPGRTDRAVRDIRASVARLWRAWFDADELVQWLPPGGMRGEVLAFESQVGGALKMRLTFTGAHDAKGKSDADSDLIDAVFAEIVPEGHFAIDVTFPSDDPAVAGTMRMTWRFEPVALATRVSVICENVPEGISAADHMKGLAESLVNLARHVE